MIYLIIELTELYFVQNYSHPTWSGLNSDRNFQERELGVDMNSPRNMSALRNGMAM